MSEGRSRPTDDKVAQDRDGRVDPASDRPEPEVVESFEGRRRRAPNACTAAGAPC